MRVDVFRFEFLNAARKAGNVIKREDYLGKVVKTWDHKPGFVVKVSLTAPGPMVTVDTDDSIYGYVSRGTTGPYPIFAGYYTGKSDKKTLAIPTESRPKTRPNQVHSGPGYTSADRVYRPYVEHPGIKARNFDQVIARDRQSWFKGEMEKALRVAVAKCGHAI